MRFLVYIIIGLFGVSSVAFAEDCAPIIVNYTYINANGQQFPGTQSLSGRVVRSALGNKSCAYQAFQSPSGKVSNMTASGVPINQSDISKKDWVGYHEGGTFRGTNVDTDFFDKKADKKHVNADCSAIAALGEGKLSECMARQNEVQQSRDKSDMMNTVGAMSLSGSQMVNNAIAGASQDQESAMKAYKTTMEVSGSVSTATGAAQLMEGFAQLNKAQDYKRWESEAKKKQGSDSARQTGDYEHTMSNLKDQMDTRNKALKDQAYMTILGGVKNLASGAGAIITAKTIPDINNSASSSNPTLGGDGLNSGDVQNTGLNNGLDCSIPGLCANGVKGGSSGTGTDDSKDLGMKDLGAPVGSPNDGSIDGKAPEAATIQGGSGSVPSGGGGGGGGGFGTPDVGGGGGGESALHAGREKQGNDFSIMGGAAGGRKGGGGEGEGGLKGLLSQLLPKKEENLANDSYMDLGGSKQLSSAEMNSLLGPDGNLFKRVTDRMVVINKEGRLK